MTYAYEYARALFMLSEEERTTEKIYADLCVARDAFLENPDYSRLLDTPAVSKAERLGLIDKAFSSLDVSLVNLIKILAEKRLSYIFPTLADEYSLLYDEARGILRADAISAVPMTSEQTEKLKKKLSEFFVRKSLIANHTACR